VKRSWERVTRPPQKLPDRDPDGWATPCLAGSNLPCAPRM
jgi:hypothetical protein